jgi:hypothetical protein
LDDVVVQVGGDAFAFVEQRGRCWSARAWASSSATRGLVGEAAGHVEVLGGEAWRPRRRTTASTPLTDREPTSGTTSTGPASSPPGVAEASAGCSSGLAIRKGDPGGEHPAGQRAPSAAWTPRRCPGRMRRPRRRRAGRRSLQGRGADGDQVGVRDLPGVLGDLAQRVDLVVVGSVESRRRVMAAEACSHSLRARRCRTGGRCR